LNAPSDAASVGSSSVAGKEFEERMDQYSEPSTKRTALVVDDEDQVRAVLQMAVRALGYEAEAAVSGQEALGCLARRSYDVVICDLRMPDMTGDEVFRICREQPPEVARRFVFLSGCSGGERSADFANASGQPCLLKPCRIADVQAAVDQLACPVVSA
jgi:two-component system, NtrC family, sensor kinase